MPEHLDYGLEKLNREISAWLVGSSQPPVAIYSPEAPFWTRQYGAENVAPEVCIMLKTVLQALGVKRMVVGHSIQPGGVSAACDEQLYRVDVGLAAFYGNNQVQVLQIENQQTRVLQ